MASLFRVPEVAAGATEATLSEWVVAEDQAVTADQTIVVIETDKATVEVEAGQDGVLLRQLARGGETVQVGAPMALFGTESERGADVDALLAGLGVLSGDGPATPAVPAPAAMGSVHAAPEPETAAEPEVAEEQAAPAHARSGSPAPAAGPAPTGGRVFASPLARRILAEAGIPLHGVTGSGPGGRIVRKDAELAVASGRTAPADEPAVAAPPPAAAPVPAAGTRRPAPAAGWHDEPHSRVRRAIASRLTTSKQTVPHFYVKRTARLDALLDLRRQLNEVSATRISVNDLVLRAVAVTHTQVPEANAVWTEDAVRVFDSVDVAVAIASQRGLVTPVLRDVDRTAPSAVAATVRDFVARADAGTLAQRDLEGGSIAVTNLGMYGVEEFAAIINPPQSAILAVGAAAPTAVVDDGVLAVATVGAFVLSVDHRVVDGALAARWMAQLVRNLEQPLRLLA
ncbi:dihydrolipoamide acetyltransferase family protein [Modestobacter sp. SSW1-42]|uniref:dihydrolipoamide acetyltransferase family protein n=1 Tax=Modestobacter sp. SSW1-42 TaxID=596372 RepID=UPI003987DABA